MVEFSSSVLRLFMMAINKKSGKNDEGKCLGCRVSSCGTDLTEFLL